jgi:hypothetical protein
MAINRATGSEITATLNKSVASSAAHAATLQQMNAR